MVARAALYEPSDVFGDALSAKELRALKRAVESENAHAVESDKGDGDGEDEGDGVENDEEGRDGDLGSGGGSRGVSGIEPGGGSGNKVEGSLRAFDRTLLQVAAALEGEPGVSARTLLTVAARGTSPRSGPYGGGGVGGPTEVRKPAHPSVLEKRAMAALVESTHGTWLAAAHKAGPALVRGMEIRMSDPHKVAGLVSHTRDAERAMGGVRTVTVTRFAPPTSDQPYLCRYRGSAFRLNVSAFYGIGGTFRGCLVGVWEVLGVIEGCIGCTLCQKRLRLS